MKKFILCVLAVMISAFPAVTFAANPVKDSKGNMWVVMLNDETARMYYANVQTKQEAISRLISRGVAKNNAENLYYTVFKYVYTRDAKKYAVSEAKHYDIIANLLFTETYSESERQYISLSSPNADYGALKLAPKPSVKRVPKKKTPKRKTATK